MNEADMNIHERINDLLIYAKQMNPYLNQALI